MTIFSSQRFAIVKVIVLGLIVLVFGEDWLRQIVARLSEGSPRADWLALYVLNVGLSFIALAVAPFIPYAIVRIPTAIVFAAALWSDQLAQSISGQNLTLDFIRSLLTVREQTDAAIEQYLQQLIVWTGVCTLIAVVFSLPVNTILRPKHSFSVAAAVLPALSILSAFAQLQTTRRFIIEELPPHVGVPARLAVIATSKNYYNGPREQVAYREPLQSAFEKIVLIVDESIRPDAMGIHDPALSNTPHLQQRRKQFVSFGTAISSFNCSVGARFVLRTGLKEDQLPDKAHRGFRKASIWQYAKHAGFRTVHLDAWRNKKGFHSFMNAEEVKAIDEIPWLTATSAKQIDMALAREIAVRLASPGKEFIFVEKYGVHAPYNRILESAADTPAGSSRLIRDAKPEARAEIAQYLSAVKQQVDSFFEEIPAHAISERVLIIYTSDHGQSLYQGTYPGTHCTNIDPVPGEGYVPLIIFPGSGEFMQRLQSSAAQHTDQMTHFEIFPTTLYAMGYSRDWVNNVYGKTVFDTPTRPYRRFLTGYPFGGNARWRAVPWPSGTVDDHTPSR